MMKLLMKFNDFVSYCIYFKKETDYLLICISVYTQIYGNKKFYIINASMIKTVLSYSTILFKIFITYCNE